MMSNFTREFISRNKISFTGMRETALSLLPNDKMVLDKLYNDLKRGINILDDEMHLNMYLRSFGKMHKAKLDTAFTCLPDISSIFSEEIEVYDWGCGQGIGRTRQTLWRAVQMLTQKLSCQTIHDCPKVVPLHYESEWQ